MLRSLLVASLLVAATTATARAQAPGESDVSPPGMTPVGAQDPCGGGCSARESVMARRWSIGLSVGHMGIAPKNAPSGTQTDYSIGELSLRYRFSRNFELEGIFGGGGEQLSDGTQGDRQVNLGALDLRYRFNPEGKWNLWLLGGLGGISVASQYASDQERKDAQRGMVQLGVGIERRFHRFALQAELRSIAISPPDNATVKADPAPGTITDPGAGMPTGGMLPPPPPPGTTTTNMDGEKAGQFTVGASFYF